MDQVLCSRPFWWVSWPSSEEQRDFNISAEAFGYLTGHTTVKKGPKAKRRVWVHSKSFFPQGEGQTPTPTRGPAQALGAQPLHIHAQVQVRSCVKATLCSPSLLIPQWVPTALSLYIKVFALVLFSTPLQTPLKIEFSRFNSKR